MKRQKRVIKLQQLRNDTFSLTDLARHAQANLNITISGRTVSRILREFDLTSYVAKRKPQTIYEQRRLVVLFDGQLNSAKYIDILENNLTVVFGKFPVQQSNKIWHQQDNARPHVSAKALKYFNKKHVKLISWLHLKILFLI
ncbi:unnamed protein product [Rotaria socialis]|uniref:Transposase Tc1-like domain-containing protein n=1 Tax=Rotaria socialis TaxID=392032 RepID=A0A821RRP5_9BILA|nr:unnamed protein product [Rotaria socialis]